MPQPPEYERQYSFKDFQESNPTDPLPATGHETELNAIKVTLDAILVNLKLIQRDDGALANQSVGEDQLEASLRIGINPAVMWQAGVAYAINDTVVFNDSGAGRTELWRATVAHTSTADFDTDSLTSGFWTKLADLSTLTIDAANAGYDNSTSGLTATDVQAAIDEIDAALDALDAAIVSRVATTTAVSSKTVGGSVNTLFTNGYAAEGDGGGAQFKRVGSEPSHAFKAQSADGAWWEGVPSTWGVSVHQFGAKGDDSADDTAAIQAAIDYANSKGQTIWLHRGKTYRVGSLSMNKVQNFAMRTTSSMPRAAAPAAAALAYHGTAGNTLLYLHGVLMADIEGVVFKYGSAAPDAYIKTDFDTGFGTSTHRLHNVLFFGNGKSDGSIGFDMGPAELQNDSDHDWGRVEFRSIQTGWRFNHSQCAGYHVDYIRGVGCGTLIDIVKGGNAKIGTLNCTNNDLDVKMRGGGSNVSTLTIDNAHVEWSPSEASAVFLDAAATNTAPITVVLNNPIVQNGYTGTFIKVGKSATVLCNGGHLNGGDIDVSGTLDGGDALFVMLGGLYGGTFTTNDFGYYEQRWPNVHTSNHGNKDPFGRASVARAGRAIGFDRLKMKAAARNYTTMPLSTSGSSSVRRAFPSTALITGIELVIETNGASGTNDFGKFVVGGVQVAEIAMRVNGPRKIGWRAHDLDADDTAGPVLGDPSVTTGFSSTPEVQWAFSAGDLADFKTATGHLIVEWIDADVGLTGSDP